MNITTIALLVIFAISIVLWTCGKIEWGSILCLCGLMLLPGVTPATIFTSSFGNNTIMFLIFSMLLTYGLNQTGILKRIALLFINNPIAKKNSYSFIGFYFLSMLIIGSFIAPTTLFILYFGIATEIFNCMGWEKGDPISRRMMVGTGFFASISCAMTPIAHTFPIMALGFYENTVGTAISYGEYLKYSLPIGLILGIAAFGLLCIKLPKLNNINYSYTLEKISTKEILSLIVFIFVILWWIIVGIFPSTFTKLNALGTAFPAMIGCIIMAILGCLNVKEGMSKGVSWSSILLCAATLSLGAVLKMDEFGILPLITSIIGNNVSMLLIICFAVILTNIISNIVTTTLSFNIFIPILIASGLINPAVATIAIGIGASLAYALPSSIAHIALAGGSGWATSKDMLKYGIIMVIISIAVMGVIL